jgi:hypothetical protein
MDRNEIRERSVDRDELLYNPTVLEAMYHEYGAESEIKRYVKTDVMVYEIRAALDYWLGVNSGEQYRMSERVKNECAAVDAGRPISVVTGRGDM